MEAYFHSDPRIEEWIDQIIEKIFAVCRLTEGDSEVEFQSGTQIVSKLANLLQGISIFPSEYLEDGLKQLLEQRFPDVRVITDFPTFKATMDKMLEVGLSIAIDAQNNENVDINENVNINDEDEFVDEPVIAAFASLKESALNNLDELRSIPIDSSSVIAESKDLSNPTKPYGIIRKSQVPEQADRLKYVLSNFFPNATISWNLNLMGQTFLAQVQDILIYVHNPEQSFHVDTLYNEGWKVYECNANDLLFPRRLERGIRNVQRLGNQFKNG